jgi:hypothetical protein
MKQSLSSGLFNFAASSSSISCGVNDLFILIYDTNIRNDFAGKQFTNTRKRVKINEKLNVLIRESYLINIITENVSSLRRQITTEDDII